MTPSPDETKLKFIDYISLVEPPKSPSLNFQELHKVSSELREFARQNNIVVVIKTQR